MSDTNYFISYTRTMNDSSTNKSPGYIGDVVVGNVTTSSFQLQRGYNSPVRWFVCGY